MTGARETTKTLLGQLRRHYIKPGPMPGWVFVPECGINGGPQSRADALAVGFTSTSGRILIGHELKVSRADWRKELDTAGKADFWADNCHAWYIVAPGPEIVPKEELPHGWGLMYPNPRTTTRMQVVVKATVRADRTPSWDAVRSILARLDTLQAQAMQAHMSEARQKAVDEAREQVARERAREEGETLTREQRERLTTLDRLEEWVGRDIVAWAHDFAPDGDKIPADQLAAALRLLGHLDDMRIGDASYAVDHLRRTVDHISRGLDDYARMRADLLAITDPRRVAS